MLKESLRSPYEVVCTNLPTAQALRKRAFVQRSLLVKSERVVCLQFTTRELACKRLRTLRALSLMSCEIPKVSSRLLVRASLSRLQITAMLEVYTTESLALGRLLERSCKRSELQLKSSESLLRVAKLARAPNESTAHFGCGLQSVHVAYPNLFAGQYYHNPKLSILSANFLLTG